MTLTVDGDNVVGRTHPTDAGAGVNRGALGLALAGGGTPRHLGGMDKALEGRALLGVGFSL